LTLADISILILGQVHKQQNRRQFPINFELLFSETLAEKLIARALVRQADYSSTWKVDLCRDSTEAGSNLLKRSVTDGLFLRSTLPRYRLSAIRQSTFRR
jgi:hypothetical protein